MKNFPIRKKLRYENFDYSDAGYYFVTICTKNRIPFLSKIENENVILSQYGQILEKIILETPKIRKEIEIDEYIIMPNHVHIIIVINPVENAGPHSLQQNNVTKNKLSNTIQRIKSETTRQIRKFFPNSQFSWQKSFHDRFIRDENELINIREYIARNPADWHKDEYFHNSIF